MTPITPTTDLGQFVGVTSNVTHRVAGNPANVDGIAHVTVVIREAHHGATTSGRYGLDDGVSGCADYYDTRGGRTGSSYFYWPYDGLTIETETSG